MHPCGVDLPDPERLVHAAETVRANAHAPYSGFRVGAAVQTADGHIYTGVNVENLALPLSMCAEAAAISSAVADGQREVVAVAVTADEDVSPCGGCRQVISEFAGPETPITFSQDGKVVTRPLGELLPAAFAAHLPNARPG